MCITAVIGTLFRDASAGLLRGGEAGDWRWLPCRAGELICQPVVTSTTAVIAVARPMT